MMVRKRKAGQDTMMNRKQRFISFRPCVSRAMPPNCPHPLFSVGTYFEVRIETVNRYMHWRTYLLCILSPQLVLSSVSNDIEIHDIDRHTSSFCPSVMITSLSESNSYSNRSLCI